MIDSSRLTTDTFALNSELSSLSKKNSPRPAFVVSIFYLALSLRLFRVISRYAVNIFFGDAWSFDYTLVADRRSLWQMFRLLFGPHRQGIGALFSYFIGSWSHWDSRTETFAVGAVIVCAAGCALLLKKRLYGSIAYTDVAIPLLLLSPSQFEMLVSYPNPSHGPFPLLLVVLYCLAWTVKPPLFRYGLVLLANFLLIYTGFGLFIGFFTPVLLSLDFYRNIGEKRLSRCGQLLFLFTVFLSIASLCSFFVGYKFESAVICYGSRENATVTFSVKYLFRYLWFMSLMFANFVGKKGIDLLTTTIGGLALAACVICLAFCLKRLVVAKTTTWGSKIVPTVLLGYATLFAFSTAVGRLCLDELGAAQRARYMPYMAAGLLGVYFCLLCAPRTIARNISILAFLATALVSSLSINSADRGAMAWLARGKQEWKDCYVARHDIGMCDKLADFRLDPNPDGHLQDKLDYLQQKKLNLFAP